MCCTGITRAWGQWGSRRSPHGKQVHLVKRKLNKTKKTKPTLCGVWKGGKFRKVSSKIGISFFSALVELCKNDFWAFHSPPLWLKVLDLPWVSTLQMRSQGSDLVLNDTFWFKHFQSFLCCVLKLSSLCGKPLWLRGLLFDSSVTESQRASSGELRRNYLTELRPQY